MLGARIVPVHTVAGVQEVFRLPDGRLEFEPTPGRGELDPVRLDTALEQPVPNGIDGLATGRECRGDFTGRPVLPVVGRAGMRHIMEVFFKVLHVGLCERETEGKDSRRVVFASYAPS